MYFRKRLKFQWVITLFQGSNEIEASLWIFYDLFEPVQVRILMILKACTLQFFNLTKTFRELIACLTPEN